MPADTPRGASDAAIVFVVAVLAGVLGGVWLWGELAGRLFGAGAPDAGTAELLEVVVRLPAHIGDPARAWPSADVSRMPGPVGCYSALALVLGGGVAVAALTARGLGSRFGRGSAARWATAGELRPLSLSPWAGRGLRRRSRDGDVAFPRSRRDGQAAAGTGHPGARLVLGRRGGRLLAAEHRHALVVFGPPQSGKSAGLAVPALLEWDGPAVASSIKTDLLAVTARRRRALGRVFVFDPFGLSGTTGDTWSPLRGAESWDGALETAWRLASAAEVDGRGVEAGDFWAVAAEQRLAPLLFAASRTGVGVETLVRWVYGQGARELHEALARIAGEADGERQLADAHAAYDAVRAFEAQADRTRTSIEATAQTLLRAYRFARVARSAAGCEITADRVLDERATLYLVGDAKASKLLRPLFLALLSEIVDRAYERATLSGGRLALPLLLCLDEAGNVAPLPNLAEVASTAPSHNIQLVSVFHDIQQARARYGRQAETVINSHRARMLLPGVADLETLRYFAGLIGEEEIRELTRTTGAGGMSRSEAPRRRPLGAPEMLRQLPEGHALLVYGRLAPTRLRLRLWFCDRRLRTLGDAA